MCGPGRQFCVTCDVDKLAPPGIATAFPTALVVLPGLACVCWNLKLSCHRKNTDEQTLENKSRHLFYECQCCSGGNGDGARSSALENQEPHFCCHLIFIIVRAFPDQLRPYSRKGK